jgi:hypothetical protein
MPNRFIDKTPLIDKRMSFQVASLSPSQWAACAPVPTKVDRLSTNDLVPLCCSSA